MAHYTEALGGVETVAKTTRIFYFSAKNDPSLQIFFEHIQWENIRNEFIILANLATPTKYDETIKGGLQYHCHLLENGADIERVIALWESAIESSWLENRMDDSRQLIVGPSRVLFNLRAIERHYAMYLMAQRAAARALRRSKKDQKDKVSAGENPSVASRSRPGMFGRFRGRRRR
jgi:truncated hemoglobin YjbI